jgi:UDP-glucose:(heptosyl)LPS alpha-1,3-glucosyltransferase
MRLNRRGGTEAVLYRTAEGLRDLGHEVHLFCGEYSIPPPQGTFAHRVPYWPLGRAVRLMSFAFLAPRAIRQFGCDLVVSFGRLSAQDIVRSGGGSHRVFLHRSLELAGPTKRLWYRLSPYHRCVIALEKRQFANGGCRKVIAISRQVKKEIVDSYGVSPDKIAVIYNGVDLERFHPRNRKIWREKVREQWKIPSDRPVVLFVGNGFRRKGLDVLIRALALPGMEYLTLLVVGADRRVEHYLQGVRSLGLSDRVIFAGVDPRVERCHAAADVFAMPSFQEAFGNVSLEALASGLPIVTTAVSGSAEILEGDLKEGILQNGLDADELRKRLLRLIELTRSTALGEAARRVAEKFSWDKYFLAFEQQLKELGDVG